MTDSPTPIQQELWAARVRPAFLYLVYLLIGFSVPVGITSAIDPNIAVRLSNGVKVWLDAIPSDLYDAMILGYLGYTGARTWEKTKIFKNKS